MTAGRRQRQLRWTRSCNGDYNNNNKGPINATEGRAGGNGIDQCRAKGAAKGRGKDDNYDCDHDHDDHVAEARSVGRQLRTVPRDAVHHNARCLGLVVVFLITTQWRPVGGQRRAPRPPGRQPLVVQRRQCRVRADVELEIARPLTTTSGGDAMMMTRPRPRGRERGRRRGRGDSGANAT